MGRFFTSGPETVHGTPDAWGQEVTDAEDDGVVESGAVPFYCGVLGARRSRAAEKEFQHTR